MRRADIGRPRVLRVFLPQAQPENNVSANPRAANLVRKTRSSLLMQIDERHSGVNDSDL